MNNEEKSKFLNNIEKFNHLINENPYLLNNKNIQQVIYSFKIIEQLSKESELLNSNDMKINSENMIVESVRK